MNARSILPEELRKRIAHLNVFEIRELVVRLECDTFQLRTFLKVFDANKKHSSRRRRLSRNNFSLNKRLSRN